MQQQPYPQADDQRPADGRSLVHWFYDDEPVAICGAPSRGFYYDPPREVDCVVCLELDAIYSEWWS
jgi:hypothetical protein